jgi:2-C-methyl-D-erythritol 2,4-cyclodiphosphate synthase
MDEFIFRYWYKLEFLIKCSLMGNKISYTKTGIGKMARRFLPEDSSKPCVIGGVIFDGVPGMQADSDGDVVFHAICNAITSISGKPILNGIARDLSRKDGITDSQVYVEKGLSQLGDYEISHVALCIEGKRPLLESKIPTIREKIAQTLKIEISQVGITVVSGEALSDCACGDGLECTCILSIYEP